jgi:CheY-like chemotaxis protein
MVDRATFEREVQDALDHLYDPSYLLVHPLATLFSPRDGVEPPQDALHRILKEAIGVLKPPAGAPLHSPAWRLYRYLSLRYVEMLTIGQVAAELGISPRQCRRDHHDAINAVSSILWEKYTHRQPEVSTRDPVPSPSDADAALLETELGKIGSRSTAAGTRLDESIESVISTLSTLSSRKDVALQVTIPADLLPVAVERTVLRQILLEILLDAIDRGAGGTLTLNAASEGNQVRLDVVVHKSVGASSAEPSDVSPDDTRLAVSRRLADLQGVTLLVAQRADDFAVQLTLPTAETPVVLVVDDNADVVHLFRRYLGSLYEVHEATSGQQALRLARQLQPAIITLDVMMPSQDGWEVLQTLKHDPITAHTPVVVCSVLRERELAFSLGASAFLAKPITANELLAALDRCHTSP